MSMSELGFFVFIHEWIGVFLTSFLLGGVLGGVIMLQFMKRRP